MYLWLCSLVLQRGFQGNALYWYTYFHSLPSVNCLYQSVMKTARRVTGSYMLEWKWTTIEGNYLYPPRPGIGSIFPSLKTRRVHTNIPLGRILSSEICCSAPRGSVEHAASDSFVPPIWGGCSGTVGVQVWRYFAVNKVMRYFAVHITVLTAVLTAVNNTVHVTVKMLTFGV